MKKNANHPVKGSCITVSPIREHEDLKAVKALLKNSPRNLALFTLGINSALRASDLLRIKLSHVRHLKAGDYFTIIERKTRKKRRVILNRASRNVLSKYLESVELPDHKNALLFPSREGRNQPLKVPTLNKLVKKWCREAGLNENYGSHTLRKTFGYHQRVTYKTDIPTLMLIFNHSNQRQTLTYLGIHEEEVHDCLMKEI